MVFTHIRRSNRLDSWQIRASLPTDYHRHPLRTLRRMVGLRTRQAGTPDVPQEETRAGEVHVVQIQAGHPDAVAPHAGAWIEYMVRHQSHHIFNYYRHFLVSINNGLYYMWTYLWIEP